MTPRPCPPRCLNHLGSIRCLLTYFANVCYLTDSSISICPSHLSIWEIQFLDCLHGIVEGIHCWESTLVIWGTEYFRLSARFGGLEIPPIIGHTTNWNWNRAFWDVRGSENRRPPPIIGRPIIGNILYISDYKIWPIFQNIPLAALQLAALPLAALPLAPPPLALLPLAPSHLWRSLYGSHFTCRWTTLFYWHSTHTSVLTFILQLLLNI